jgi:hypothetical protein
MKKTKHMPAIAELSEAEGVFTTAQAERMGITRDALHDAVESGRLDRVVRGAYRMVGSGSTYADELIAIWKLTDPSAFSHERMRFDTWDGIAVGGHTAASLLGIGDFHLSPYRIYAPRRINSRNPVADFAKRHVSREEVAFTQGLPVTKADVRSLISCATTRMRRSLPTRFGMRHIRTADLILRSWLGS